MTSQTPFLSLVGDYQSHIVSSAFFVSLLSQADTVPQESSEKRLVEDRTNERRKQSKEENRPNVFLFLVTHIHPQDS